MADFDRDFDFDEDSLREIESNESLLFTQEEPISKSPDENRSPAKSSRKNLLLDIFDRTPEVEDLPEESSRKALLLDIMSKPASPKECAPLKNLLIDSFPKKTPENIRKKERRSSPSPFKRPASPNPKEPSKTLVRKFPGPAGLLSFSKGSPTAGSRVQKEVDEDMEESSEPSFCSQDTKKLFTDGAWRLMVSELPQDYLAGKDIASIKNSGRSKKIPVLAGIIDKINWSGANPRVTLKDISDSIEGMMHKDIFARYPNTLQPGVVVLLHDVGILNLRGMKASLTTSIVFISPISIVAAYNDKCRIITTPELTKLMQQKRGVGSLQDNVDSVMDTSDLELDDNLFEGFAVQQEPADAEDNQSSELVGRETEIPGTTFGDHLLDDSDDELMSQIPLSPEKEPEGGVRQGGAQVGEDTFEDSDDELLSQFDVDAVVSTYNK